MDEIEDLDASLGQITGHPLGIAQNRHPALENQPVEARHGTSDLILASFEEFLHNPPQWIIAIFGSGLSGLGSGLPDIRVRIYEAVYLARSHRNRLGSRLEAAKLKAGGVFGPRPREAFVRASLMALQQEGHQNPAVQSL